MSEGTTASCTTDVDASSREDNDESGLTAAPGRSRALIVPQVVQVLGCRHPFAGLLTKRLIRTRRAQPRTNYDPPRTSAAGVQPVRAAHPSAGR